MGTNTYIAEVKAKAKDVNKSFNDFINLLERLEKEPWLVLTDFSSKLENPIFSIAAWGPSTFQDNLLPLVHTIPQFAPFLLQSSQYGKSIQVLDAELDRCVLTIDLQEATFEPTIKNLYEPELDEKTQESIELREYLLKKINRYGLFYKFYLSDYERFFDEGNGFLLTAKKQKIQDTINRLHKKLEEDYEHDMRAYLKNKDLKEKNENRVNELMSYLISLNFTQKR